MKNYILEFVRRGLCASGFGPIILAIVYWIMYQQGIIQTLTVLEVCSGIFSLFILAFIAGGMNAIYQIERIPLMIAILIHGGILYICYLITYLFNGWLEFGAMPIMVFSCIFVFFYLVIWVIIFSLNKRNTDKINKTLKLKQQKVNLDD